MVEQTVQSRAEQAEKPLEDMTLDELDEVEDEEDERILQQYRYMQSDWLVLVFKQSDWAWSVPSLIPRAW